MVNRLIDLRRHQDIGEKLTRIDVNLEVLIGKAKAMQMVLRERDGELSDMRGLTTLLVNLSERVKVQVGELP